MKKVLLALPLLLLFFACGQGTVWMPEGDNVDAHKLTQLSDEDCGRYGLGPGCYIDELQHIEPNDDSFDDEELSSEEETSSADDGTSEEGDPLSSSVEASSDSNDPLSSTVEISSELPVSSETVSSIAVSSAIEPSSVVEPSSAIEPSSATQSSIAVSSNSGSDCSAYEVFVGGSTQPKNGEKYRYCSPEKLFEAKNGPGTWETPDCNQSNWFWNLVGEC